MFLKIQEAVNVLNQEYMESFCVSQDTRTTDLQKIGRFLEGICEEHHTVFVHGREKRKSREQRYLELFRRFLDAGSILKNNGRKTLLSVSECNGRFWILEAQYIKKQKSKSGYESQVTVYECKDCTGCYCKEKCTKSKKNKHLYVPKSFIEKREEYYKNILSETGIRYRMNRSIRVEGAFGVLKNDYGFRRFLLRGKTRVKLEVLLLC